MGLGVVDMVVIGGGRYRMAFGIFCLRLSLWISHWD